MPKSSRCELTKTLRCFSGTAGVACQQTERNFIGIEKDVAIYRTACERMGIKQEHAA